MQQPSKGLGIYKKSNKKTINQSNALSMVFEYQKLISRTHKFRSGRNNNIMNNSHVDEGSWRGIQTSNNEQYMKI